MKSVEMMTERDTIVCQRTLHVTRYIYIVSARHSLHSMWTFIPVLLSAGYQLVGVMKMRGLHHLPKRYCFLFVRALVLIGSNTFDRRLAVSPAL